MWTEKKQKYCQAYTHNYNILANFIAQGMCHGTKNTHSCIHATPKMKERKKKETRFKIFSAFFSTRPFPATLGICWKRKESFYHVHTLLFIYPSFKFSPCLYPFLLPFFSVFTMFIPFFSFTLLFSFHHVYTLLFIYPSFQFSPCLYLPFHLLFHSPNSDDCRQWNLTGRMDFIKVSNRFKLRKGTPKGPITPRTLHVLSYCANSMY